MPGKSMKLPVRISPEEIPHHIPVLRLFEIGLKAARANRDLVSSVVIKRTTTRPTSVRVSAEQFFEMMILDLRPRETVMIGISIVRSSLAAAGIR